MIISDRPMCQKGKIKLHISYLIPLIIFREGLQWVGFCILFKKSVEETVVHLHTIHSIFYKDLINVLR